MSVQLNNARDVTAGQAIAYVPLKRPAGTHGILIPVAAQKIYVCHGRVLGEIVLRDVVDTVQVRGVQLAGRDDKATWLQQHRHDWYHIDGTRVTAGGLVWAFCGLSVFVLRFVPVVVEDGMRTECERGDDRMIGGPVFVRLKGGQMRRSISVQLIRRNVP